MEGLEEQNKQLQLRVLLAKRRSRELNRLKLKDIFNPRTVMLCDNSNFADFVGHIDEAFFLSHVPMVGFPPDAVRKNQFCSSKVSKVDCFTIKGEMFYVKCKQQQTIKDNDLALTLLGYEAKILQLIGNHDNINEMIGMTFLNDSAPALLFRNLPQNSLKDRIESLTGFLSLSWVNSFIDGLCEAVTYIHSQGVIHNNIHLNSVRVFSYSGFPVLTNFEFACRIESSKPLNILLREKFDDKLDHLPFSVKNMEEAPSVSSDQFYFGFILTKVGSKLGYIETDTLRKYNKLVQRCLNRKGILCYLVRDWKYW